MSLHGTQHKMPCAPNTQNGEHPSHVIFIWNTFIYYINGENTKNGKKYGKQKNLTSVKKNMMTRRMGYTVLHLLVEARSSCAPAWRITGLMILDEIMLRISF